MTRSNLMAHLALLMLSGMEARTDESHHWSRLQVKEASLAPIERINGLPVQIIRFTGAQVGRLEWEWWQGWLSDRNSLWTHTQTSGPWRLHSRVTVNGQEVLQSRGTGASMELLWSSLGLVGSPVRTHLPSRCEQGFVIEGRDLKGRFSLATAVCRERFRPKALVSLRRETAEAE